MGADGRLSVYITGATTAPGLALLRALVARDHYVSGSAATLVEAQRLRAAGALPVYINERDAGELAGALRLTEAKVLIHAAPLVASSLLPDEQQLAAALDSLGAGTAALLTAAAACDDCFIIHCSHACLYGDTQGEAVSEDAALAGAGALFEAAVAAEQVMLAAATPACILRAGLLYGPESASLSALRAALLDGGGLPPGIAQGMASWLHFEDLALAVALAAEQQPAHAILNVADDRPATRSAFLEHFAQRMGLLPPQPGRFGAVLHMLRRPAAGSALLASAFSVSNARIRATLGWAPQYADVESGLEQTLLAWRAAAARA